MLLFLAAACSAPAGEPVREIAVDPLALRLNGPGATHSLLVHGTTADGRLTDLTAGARLRSSNPAVAEVRDNVVRATGDGTAVVEVEAVGQTARLSIRVSGTALPRPLHFDNDILPVLSRFGCNSSACHGKAEGQNGFKLSVFGFDPGADHAALVKESRGRRVLPSAPEQSLLLAKASGAVAHGGGVRLPRGSPGHETLRAWVAAGAPMGDPAAPRLAAIRVEPRERSLALGGRQQLRVMARYSDGRESDVTGQARFQSNNDGLATVSATGLVTAGTSPGEAAVMASFLSEVDVFRAVIPLPGRPDPQAAWPENNFIDALVNARLKKLNVVPSGPADDAEFLRRACLDITGTAPTADEARRFLADPAPGKRARLVGDLLRRPEYAEFWALKWSDVLRVDRQALGHRRAHGYYRWVRDSLARNKPYDKFARELLIAEGPLHEVGPASFYKAVSKPGEAAGTLSQVFLGVRIACAECHHHPYDRWAQSDYFGMQAFFTPLAVRGGPRQEVLLASGAAVAKNPRTGATVAAHALGAARPPALLPGDARVTLADWMTGPDNPWFARNLANRMWAHFLGRGLVEPVDDVRPTNPPTNPELLDALARHFRDSGYDLHALIRAVTASRAYQRSSRPNASNERDTQNAARAPLKRLDAEVLLDMVAQATGVPTRFSGAPPGTRAVQLWDSKTSHEFLKLFGRPARATACECERNHEPGVAQVLHLLNSPDLHARLTHEDGTVARLVRRTPDNAALADELYLTFTARSPTAQERQFAVTHLARDPARRREAAEDLAWSLLNSLEFVFNH